MNRRGLIVLVASLLLGPACMPPAAQVPNPRHPGDTISRTQRGFVMTPCGPGCTSFTSIGEVPDERLYVTPALQEVCSPIIPDEEIDFLIIVIEADRLDGIKADGTIGCLPDAAPECDICLSAIVEQVYGL